MANRIIPGYALTAIFFLGLSCNEIPVKNITDSYSIIVQKALEKSPTSKLDILWIIDDSPSLCQEQRSLTKNFHSFLEVLNRYVGIDARIAVSSTEICLDDKKPNKPCKSTGTCGKFLYRPPVTFPPACLEEEISPCQTDPDCNAVIPNLDDNDNWTCKPVLEAKYIYTCDCPSKEYAGAMCKQITGDNSPDLVVVNTRCFYNAEKIDLKDKSTWPNSKECTQMFGTPEICETFCKDNAKNCISECMKYACDDKCSRTPTCASKQCEELCKEKTSNVIDLCNAACQGNCSDICYTEGLTGECAEKCSEFRCYYFDINACETCKKTCCKESCMSASDFQDFCSDSCSNTLGCGDLCKNKFCAAGSCEAVCQAGNSCMESCINTFGEYFTCYMMCEYSKAYSCKDQCAAFFGDSSFKTVELSAKTRGCMLPPSTEFCPGTKKAETGKITKILGGPKVLDSSVVDEYYNKWKTGEWKGNPCWHNITAATEDEKEKLLKKTIFEYLFLCMATVGAEQELCGSKEQGLLASWMALDPLGQNAEQAKSFLREDAYLLIIYVSDEEDCSTEKDIPSGNTGDCPCLYSSDKASELSSGEKPMAVLYPVDTFVNRLKSLKKDPSMVMVAAIAGDAIPGTATSPASDDVKKIEDTYKNCLSTKCESKKDCLKEYSDCEKDCLANKNTELEKINNTIRNRFRECACDKKNQLYRERSYICRGQYGEGQWGKRYFELVQKFGYPWGIATNLCEEKGFAEVLTTIAEQVVKLITSICLPRPVDTIEDIDVYKVLPSGDKMLLKRGKPEEGGDYLLIKSPTCLQFTNAKVPQNALYFNKALEATDRLDIIYKAEPFYKQE
jgi:hypothetical protein